ncbi:MAG: hypothetical protein U5P41_11295 [Gammaproteobacteria bacterium]|nr:hypothetical protein [Gammaproteobacteria bacterium]
MNALVRFLRSDTPTGLKIMLISVIIALISMLPLFVYILVGPADGNPIGLGLLAFFGMFAGLLGCLIGMLWLVLYVIKNRRGTGRV